MKHSGMLCLRKERIVLITKFNKLIKNKIMWGLFAAIVCFSFVFGSVFGRGGDNRKQGVAGMLFDEEISNREFFEARFFELGMRERPGLSPEANKMLRDRAWKRIAALKAAEKMGLAASPPEIGEMIQKDPTFQVNGVFNKARYEATIGSQLRVPIQTFEEYVRQDILTRKLMRVMQSMVWTAPADVNRRLENITDQFKLEYAVLPEDTIVTDVQVTMEDARKYYEEDRAQFTEPEKINVKYVAFPISNYLASVTVSEDEMSEYYQEHQSDYASSSTNENSEPLPFDDAKDDITALLSRRKATFLARDEATDLVMALAPGRYTAGLNMQEATAGRNLALATTELFSATGNVDGLDDVDSEFNRTAFNLDSDSSDAYFSDPIVGQDNVYVIAANERVESRIPAFDEVTDAVMKAAEASAKKKAFFEKCDQIRAEVIAGEEPFAQTMEKYGASVSTTEVFTVYDANEDMEFSDVMIPEIMKLRQGEYTECIPTAVGAMLAYVVERQPGDMATAQLLRPQLQTTLDQYRGRIVYEDWGDFLLVQAGFKDISEAYDVGEGDEEEGED